MEYTTQILISCVILLLSSIVVILSFRKFRRLFTVLLIFLFSLSILLLFQATSPHIIGKDVEEEKFFIEQTSGTGKWENSGYSTNLESSLSISIFPAIICLISNISSEFYLKYISIIIFSLVPVILFLIFEKMLFQIANIIKMDFLTEKNIALISVFIFIFNFAFFLLPAYNRMILAYLGIALSVYILITESINYQFKLLLLISFSLMIFYSHYSTAVFWLCILIPTFVLFYIINYTKNNYHHFRPLQMALIIIIIFILWYIFISITTGAALLKISHSILENLEYFSNLGYRSDLTETLFLSPFNQIYFLLMKSIGNTIRLLIVIGLVYVIFQFSLQKRTDQCPVILFLLISALSFSLIASMFLPKVSFIYGVDRIYFQSLLVISVFYIIGIAYSLNLIRSKLSISEKNIIKILIGIGTILLLSQFLLQTDTIGYYMNAEKNSILFSNPANSNHFVTGSEIASINWYNLYIHPEKIIFVKYGDPNFITGYGGIWLNRIEFINNKEEWKSRKELLKLNIGSPKHGFIMSKSACSGTDTINAPYNILYDSRYSKVGF